MPPVQDVLRLRFVGARAAPRAVPQDELAERTNYFRGRASSSWHTDIPNYAQVTYRDLYPGIDLVYYGNQGELEYDLVVRPGASPSAVRLSFQGAAQVSADAQGGSAADAGYGVAGDFDGNLFATGSTSSSDFPTSRALQGSPAGGADAFVAKAGLAPAPPVVADVLEDDGAVGTDRVTSAQTLRAYGTADPNSTVTVSRDGTGPVGSATADGTGNWALSYPSVTLAPNATATFAVRLDGSAAKTSEGVISFSTNDADEWTFEVPVLGLVTPLSFSPTIIIGEDEKPEVRLAGTWTDTANATSNEGDYFLDSAATTGRPTPRSASTTAAPC